MGKVTAIAWCHHTFNAWWGCTRVSPGCVHCYAEVWAKRTGHQVWGVDAPRRFFGATHWAEPRKWNAEAEKAGERRRVFCSSMADVFERHPDRLVHEEMEHARSELWRLIEQTPALDWLLLTKRPEHLRTMLPASWLESPRPHVWLGTTAEDQPRADERISWLIEVPAAQWFISAEPLLSGLDIAKHRPGANRLWVIVGGESGPGARPCEVWWIANIVGQCQDAGAPVFVKQLGAVPVIEAQRRDVTDASAREAYERERAEIVRWPRGTRFGNPTSDTALNGRVILLRDPKGGDPLEWPEDLRVREVPR